MSSFRCEGLGEYLLRRYTASGFLLLIAVQSLGIAHASERVANNGASVGSTIPAVDRPSVVAAAAGAYDAASRLLMPHLIRHLAPIPAETFDASTARLARPVYVLGTPERIAYPKAPPRGSTRDPLAMRHHNNAASPVMLRVRPASQHLPIGEPLVPPIPHDAATSQAGAFSNTPHVFGAAQRRVAAAGSALSSPGPMASPLPGMIAASDAGTGITPYWNYQTRAIPGLGGAMVNVGTGNLILQSTDVDLPEEGLDLAFIRTYNSQSRHDANGDDGSEPSVFGNGWTNTYDAHIVYQASTGDISVYDENGARCDYQPNGNGGWIPCTGQHATLQPDPNSACSYWWTQKDGTAIWFRSDNPGPGCNFAVANDGRVYEIVGRNSNNKITFQYSFSGPEKTSNEITQIVVNHSDGHSLTMNFAKFSGINELATMTYPLPSHQGQLALIQYSYDTSGDLDEVDKPGNDAGSQVPGGHNVPAGDLPEIYGFQQPIQYACGPRATIGIWTNPSSPTDGACLHLDYDSNVRLTDWVVNGILNPQVGNQGVLQQGAPTTWSSFYTGNFVYGAGNNPPCSGTSSGTTTMCDTDGHSVVWTIDASDRVTMTQAATGKSSPSNLTTKQSWDSNDNLIATTDPSGNETDYAYDRTGNLTAIGLPPVTDVVGKGSFRPTWLYSYDTNNNVLAGCDPWYTDSLGKDWNGNPGPSDSLCPQTIGSQNSQGATVYQYDTSDTAEPSGKLIETFTPMGYYTKISYNAASEGGDFGLPTDRMGQTITQNDNSQIAVQAHLTYDTYGNVLTYGNSIGKWTTTYNNVNWPISATDPTGVTSYTCYNSDGSVSSATSALQYSFDGVSCGQNSTSYQHDVDGNVTLETRHYNSTRSSYNSGNTYKWYDGLDRLVAVELPADANIDNNNPTWTKYDYDLSQLGGSASLDVGGSGGVTGIVAYGNLYKTQRCFTSSCSWQTDFAVDFNGNAYDALDRPTARYQYSPTSTGTSKTPGTSPGPLSTWTLSYDQSEYLGLETAFKDPIGTRTSFTYDTLNRMQSKSFSDGTTPNVTDMYDLDGRIASLASSVGSETYAYDFDGRLTSYAEGGNVADPESLTYSYYANGWRSQLNISDPTASYHQPYYYNYRADGARLTLNYPSQQSFTWTYDNAGRELSQTDPQNGSTITPSGNPPAYTSYQIQPKTMNYDGTTGMLTTLSMPNGSQFTGITHDAEGEITGFGVNFPAFKPTSTMVSGVQYGYDRRGELNQTQSQSPSSNGYQLIQQLQFINGYPVCTAGFSCSGTIPSAGIDKNTGADLWIQSLTQLDSNGCSEPQQFSYDADGRQTYGFVGYTGPKCQNPSYGQLLADARTYDAEGHLVQDTCSYDQQYWTICGSGSSNSWGASGHLSKRGSYTAHWDGDSLLFITDSSHNVVQVNIEDLARRNAANGTLVVTDRDFAGTIAETHTNQFDSGLTAVQDYFSTFGLSRWGIPTISGQFPPNGSGPSAPILNMARTDGYQDGISAVTFQGVRTYDSNTQQWTTPDDFKGSTDDPMSQMPYLWNDNGPISHRDLSGFCSTTVYDKNGVPHTKDYGWCFQQLPASVAGDAPNTMDTKELIEDFQVRLRFAAGYNRYKCAKVGCISNATAACVNAMSVANGEDQAGRVAADDQTENAARSIGDVPGYKNDNLFPGNETRAAVRAQTATSVLGLLDYFHSMISLNASIHSYYQDHVMAMKLCPP